MAAGLLVMMLVLLVVMLLVPAAAGTANDQWPDLLPRDCGTRLVQLEDFNRLLIVGSGNTTAYYGQFPWQARIEVYKREWRAYGHQCGGIIITQRHVITAAHCVDHVALTSMQVRVGDLRSDRKDAEERAFAVATVYVHYHFGHGATHANDIALLQLKVWSGVGIEFSEFVQPACLPESDTVYEPNTECEVSGWGKTVDYLGAPISETLRGASVPLVSDEFCSSQEVYQAQFVPGRMFCAGLVRGGPDACDGDSGGPLVCRDPSNDRFVAFGIMSSGDPLGCGRLPGLYTKLSGFISWLLARIQLDLGEISDAKPSTAIPDCKSTTPAPADSGTDCGRSDFSPAADVESGSVNQTNFPWLVSIFKSPDAILPSCRGTIVSDRWILTSADCVRHVSKEEAPVAAVLNVTTRSPITMFDSIIHYALHPNYTITRHPNNLGLLQTAHRIPFSKTLRPICLPDKHLTEIKAGKTFVTTSWAQAFLENHRQQNELKWFKAMVIRDTRCRRIIGSGRYDDIFNDVPSGSVFCGRFRNTMHESGRSVIKRGHLAMVVMTTNGVRRWNLFARATGDSFYRETGVMRTGAFFNLSDSMQWIREVISNT